MGSDKLLDITEAPIPSWVLIQADAEITDQAVVDWLTKVALSMPANHHLALSPLRSGGVMLAPFVRGGDDADLAKQLLKSIAPHLSKLKDLTEKLGNSAQIQKKELERFLRAANRA